MRRPQLGLSIHQDAQDFAADAVTAKVGSFGDWCGAMGIDWMDREEIVNAVPPAYAEFIGRAAMAYLSAPVAA